MNIYNFDLVFKMFRIVCLYSDIPLQAERLVEKMQNDVTIDYEKDWKLITIFIGGNDLCAVCRNKTKYSPEAYIDNIRTTIQTLHEKVTS